MTTVINLYAGPGCGKSTLAAELFATLKKRNINCELVREYVKDWAWEKRSINDFDQYYFFGKQVRKESMLFEKVDYIITDSPVLLCGFYANKFCPEEISGVFPDLIQSYYNACTSKGVKHHHFLLERTKAYNPQGRYQTEEEARQYDIEIKEYCESILGPEALIRTEDILVYLEYLGVRK